MAQAPETRAFAGACGGHRMLVMQTTLKMESENSRTRLGEHIFRLRALGLGLGFFAVAGALLDHGAPPWVWTLLAIDGFLWPHLARQFALRGTDPERSEVNNLLIDSAMGGVWIALMQFSVVPSALLLVMLAVDKISIGGWRLFGHAFAAGRGVRADGGCQRFRIRARELDALDPDVAAFSSRLSAGDRDRDICARTPCEPPQPHADAPDARRCVDRHPEPAELGGRGRR